MTTVQIAFVLDCTASMEPWIRAAKTKIQEIVNNAKEDHPDAEFEVGLVAYRDYGDLVRFRIVDFTTPSVVMSSLRNVHAEGGDDEAEDVAHALLHATWMRWDNANVQMVFHIADAPPHGLAFHTPYVSDRFPGGDPEGLDPRESLRVLSRNNVSYTFVKITSATDTMLDVFFNAWPGDDSDFRVIDLRPQAFGRGHGVDTSDLLSPAVSQVVTQAIDRHISSQDM